MCDSSLTLTTYTNKVKHFGYLVPDQRNWFCVISGLRLEAGHSELHESNPYNIIQVWANKVL